MSDIGFPLKESYVAKSKYFYSDGVSRVVAWVEAHADKRLWMSAFERFRNHKVILKISSEFTSVDGKSANGCSRLLKLARTGELTLGAAQVLCIDSDYRHLSSLSKRYSGPSFDIDHVYWTVVHSKENIQVTDSVLDFVVSHIVAVPVPQLKQRAKTIIERFSSVIFTSLCGIYFLRSLSWEQEHKDRERFIGSFNEVLNPLKTMRALEMVDFEKTDQWLEFETLAQNLELALLEYFEATNLASDYAEFVGVVNSLGIDSSNIFLFVRGHDYHAVMVGVFKAISEGYRKAAIVEIESRKLPKKTIAQLKRDFNSAWLDFDKTLQSQRIDIDCVPFFCQTLERLNAAYG